MAPGALLTPRSANVTRFYWPPSNAMPAGDREMVGEAHGRHARGEGVARSFAMHTASDYLPRLARAARRVQRPRSCPLSKVQGFVFLDPPPYGFRFSIYSGPRNNPAQLVGHQLKLRTSTRFAFSPHWVVPRLVCLKRRQNVQSSIRETRDRVAAVRLEYRNRTMLRNTVTTWGRVPAQKARAGGCALKQESDPHLGSSDVAVVACAQEAADQAARTPWPPGRQHGRGSS